MLIVLTSEQNIKDEAQYINKFFEFGLEILHLRKPGFDAEKYKVLLNEINENFHHRIVIHQHHHLIRKFNLKGIHITEHKRLELGEKLEDYKTQQLKVIGQPLTTKSFTLSTSFHSKQDIIDCKEIFDYIFLSPVFNSISKKGYKGKNFNVSNIAVNIVGLGGINGQNISDAMALGYKGVAVLGSIWNSENPINDFQFLMDKYRKITAK